MESEDNTKETAVAVALTPSISNSPSRKHILLVGGPPWGFRTCGGRDTNIPLRIARVNPGSKAARSGIREGDLVATINGLPMGHLTNGEVQRILKKSGPSMSLELKSAKRMNTFEGSSSASNTGELESAGASSSSSSVVTKKSAGNNTTTAGGGAGGAAATLSSSGRTDNNISSPEINQNNRESTASSKKGTEKQSSSSESGTTKELISSSNSSSGGSGKSKKSPSHSSVKSGKSSSPKKKSVEINERSVDQVPQQQQIAVTTNTTTTTAEDHNNILDNTKCCTCGGGYKGYLRSSLDGRSSNMNSVALNGTAGGETNSRSSLLGEIIAELDDLLGTTYFSEPPTIVAATRKHKSHAYDSGVWSPGSTNNNNVVSSPSNKQQQQGEQQQDSKSTRKSSKGDDVVDASALLPLNEPIVPVWTPPGAVSPSSQKKFRPVNFNVPGSPTSSTSRTASLERSLSAGHVGERKLIIAASGSSDGNFVSSTPDHKEESRDLMRGEGRGSIHQNHNLHQSQSSQSVNLPKYQSPTVTLLQKAREGHLPKGALYLDHQNGGVQRSSSACGGFHSLHPQQQPTAGSSSNSQHPLSLNPNDTLYELKREDYKTTPTGATRRLEFTPRRYDGVGPTTPEGVPISLKSGISSNGHEWYRRMYESLHVEKPHRKGAPLRSPYGGPASGSWSEPEGYESDTYAYKYATLDRRKLRDRYIPDAEYLSPGPSTPTSIPGSIRFTPGRIEDYTPGNSSVAAKEIRRHKPTLQWALGSKDLGYESDSNLVIRKRQESQQEIPPPPPLSPAEQRQVYVDIQKGGEVPLHGLRKPAPEKSKAMSPMPTFEDVNRSLLSRARPGSPSSFRSGSPSMLKSGHSTVALLQERIQAKLRRANSDINPLRLGQGRSRSSPSSHAASRLIHSVRSVSHVRGSSPASFIPIRSRNTSMEKLRVSSPELTSPREVKKALETSHKLSVRLEVVETVGQSTRTTSPGGRGSSSSSGVKKSKHAGTTSSEGGEKKSGMKKSKNGKSKSSKSVKIAENGAGVGGTSTTKSNGADPGGVVPVKPPRKLQNGKSEPKIIHVPIQQQQQTNGTGKIHKTVKATPVAARHAGCLSPHHSRPTSPGASQLSSSTFSINNIPAAPKLPSAPLGVVQSSGKSIQKGDRRKSSPAAVTGGATSSSTAPSMSSKAEGQQSRSNRSLGDLLSNEKENKPNWNGRTSKSSSSLVSSTTTTAQLEKAIKAKSNAGGGKGGGGGGEQKRKRAPENFDGRLKSNEGVKGAEQQQLLRMDTATTTTTTLTSSLSQPSSLQLGSAGLHQQSSSSPSSYLTIPPKTGYLAKVWTLEEEHDSCTSRSCTPSFRSLPALTPYLKETKRVSGSLFVTKTNHAAMLRERAALAKRLGLDESSSGGIGAVSRKSSSKASKRIKGRSSSAGKEGNIGIPGEGGLGGAGGDNVAFGSGMRRSNETRSKTTGSRSMVVGRSASCLGLRRSPDYTYAKYILELQHSRKKSPRFLQLHRLYSSLERLGQLERSTSMYDVPILSLERQLDFDAWWKVRNRTRVDEEIASISSQLSTAQQNREFFFRPRRIEEFKWKGDSALRCKQWSINELRCFLMGEDFDEKRHCKSASDLHKTAWRGTSVKEVALTMEVNALSKAGFTFSESHQAFGGPWLRRAFSMSSTLSKDQRDNIKRRLGSLIKPESLRTKQEREGRPTERRVVTTRMGLTTSSDSPSSTTLYRTDSGRIIGADGCLTEAAKKQLSRSLSQEFREKKIVEKKNSRKQKSSESESAKSDDSVRTVIHVPISTQLLLKKMDKESKERDKSKIPVYSVYCSKGVPSKVSFFESYYDKPGMESGSSKQFSTSQAITKGKTPAVATAKIVKTGSSAAVGGRSVSAVAATARSSQPLSKTLGRAPAVSSSSPSSPMGTLRRSRSASPTSSSKTTLSYISHVNVISRLASLFLKKDEALKHLVTRELLERDKLERLRHSNAGEVDRLKYFFETFYANEDEYGQLLPEINLLRCLFCSDPNLAQLTEWRSEHFGRRCASADIFKEKLISEKQQQLQQQQQQQQQQQLDRKPDGRESSPVNCSSPDLYFNSRSRKPIYQPSSTPNVCQPTLTAHCFLESPNKSLEYLNQQIVTQPTSSSYSSDYSGNFWDYYSATDSVGTASPSPPYHSVSIPPPPRVLDSRISSNSTGTSHLHRQHHHQQSSSSTTTTSAWNVDPALHQPKFRYVPPEPRTNIHPMPPPLPPPPALPKLSALQHQQVLLKQQQQQYQQQRAAAAAAAAAAGAKSNIENRPCNPYLYRSVRYWSPGTRTRENEGPIPPNRNPPVQAISQNGIQSPLPPVPSASTTTATTSSSSQALTPSLRERAMRQQAWSLRQSHNDEDDYAEDIGSQTESQSPLVESQFRRQAHLTSSVSNESESHAASPLLPAPPVRYAESEVNIHYKAPVRLVEKDYVGEEELRRRQQLSMKRFYEEQRHRKFLAEIQDMENRRHTDNFTPSQKSPIPLNRYEDMTDEPQRPRWRDRTPDQKTVAKALYNFVPQNSRELSFRKGDILYIRRKLDANWYEGEHNAAIGIFPSSYVEIIPSYEMDRATPVHVPLEGQARVRFNFTAASPVEMSIIKGETVVLTRRVDINWYEGRIGSRRGIFPVSYVQVLKEPGSELTTTTAASPSPKPVGSPAAHSLTTSHHQSQNFRHNYKPNYYAMNSDFATFQYNPSTHITPTYSRDNYTGRLTQSATPNHGRSSCSQNLTIDTRIEPLSYKAIYNYRPAHEDELELRENDIVHVLEKCDDGWFVGTSTRTGLFGTFPGNYVERVF